MCLPEVPLLTVHYFKPLHFNILSLSFALTSSHSLEREQMMLGSLVQGDNLSLLMVTSTRETMPEMAALGTRTTIDYPTMHLIGTEHVCFDNLCKRQLQNQFSSMLSNVCHLSFLNLKRRNTLALAIFLVIGLFSFIWGWVNQTTPSLLQYGPRHWLNGAISQINSRHNKPAEFYSPISMLNNHCGPTAKNLDKVLFYYIRPT